MTVSLDQLSRAWGSLVVPAGLGIRKTLVRIQSHGPFFEQLRADHSAGVAQLGERCFRKATVAGSIPVAGSNIQMIA